MFYFIADILFYGLDSCLFSWGVKRSRGTNAITDWCFSQMLCSRIQWLTFWKTTLVEPLLKEGLYCEINIMLGTLIVWGFVVFILSCYQELYNTKKTASSSESWTLLYSACCLSTRCEGIFSLYIFLKIWVQHTQRSPVSSNSFFITITWFSMSFDQTVGYSTLKSYDMILHVVFKAPVQSWFACVMVVDLQCVWEFLSSGLDSLPPPL